MYALLCFPDSCGTLRLETLHSAQSAVPHQPQLAEAPTLLTTYCSNKRACIGTIIHSKAMPHSKPATLDEWCGAPLPIDDWEPTSTEASAADGKQLCDADDGQ